MTSRSYSELLSQIESAPDSGGAQLARDVIAVRAIRITFWNNIAIFTLTMLILVVTLLEAWMHLEEFKGRNGRFPWEVVSEG